MAAPTSITELSQTAGSNGPDGSSTYPRELDNYQRAHASFIAQLRDGKGFSVPTSIASASTADIGGINSLFIQVTGTTTIDSFGTNYNGPRFLKFSGSVTLTHSAALSLPGAADITTGAGDSFIAVPNFAGNGWNVFAYQQQATAPGHSATQTAGDNTTKNATTAFVTAAVAAVAGVPAGTIIDFAGTSAPSGYLACPTTATNISRTTYAALFAAIGTTWGSGDGSTTFGMPYFPADYAAVQASANVSTATTGTVKAHTHEQHYGANAVTSGSYASGSTGSDAGGTSIQTGSTGGSANLAAGVRVLKCVKT